MESDYGPVPVSQMKARSKAIFDALAKGRRVLIAKHGFIEAAIDPSTAVPSELLINFVLPSERPILELTATEINQGSPAKAIAAAKTGPVYLTKDNQIYGVIRGATNADIARLTSNPDLVTERERRIAEYLRSNPKATASDLADLAEKVDGELGISAAAPLVPAAAAEVLSSFREHLRQTAQDLAERTGELVAVPLAGSDVYDALTRTLQARVTEAVAEVATETLSGVARGSIVEYMDTTERIAEARADEALDRLTTCLAQPLSRSAQLPASKA